jgi:hypothetical protein
MRRIFIACVRWHAAHVSTWVAVFSWNFADFGECTLWHVTQDKLRESWGPPWKFVCVRAWQVRQVSLTWRAAMAPNDRMADASPVSACFWPGPWHVSHAMAAIGVRGFAALPCGVRWIAVPSASWQPRHVASPTYPDWLAGAAELEGVCRDSGGDAEMTALDSVHNHADVNPVARSKPLVASRLGIERFSRVRQRTTRPL